ncbi:hypothetical protein FHR24_002653 [Wenyingzhuangia heitensis]|uniref:LVIVD repeat-containing protein n=1 Tax=Wenyingzhuangia heitensis TaxID=1487859 RepID=A0ABX0UE66_9FLAO|nr:hypothetical protein [Wenyingzhuangia heitensis]NIJ46175.1 hypothetical protein [Wenyingzhuangia heitensis]
MKKILPFLLLFVFIGCVKEEENNCPEYNYSSSSYYLDPSIYSEYTPIEISVDNMGDLITFEEPFEVEKSGKIYIKDNLLIVQEQEKGYHFYDNSNPENPIQTKFLRIENTTDIAIRDNSFYISHYNDLVTLNINLIDFTFTETGREKEVLTNYYAYYKISPDGYYFTSSEGKVITGFIKKENFERPDFPTFMYSDCYEYSVVSDGGNKFDGQGGSLSTFTLKGDYLYTVDYNKLNSFLIEGANQKNPAFVGAINVGFGIETLSSFGDNLFIGSTSAMYIYGLQNPAVPNFKSISNHFRACDPVIANEQNAFVTIHGGSRCGGDSNQLKVYNITDVENPVLLLDKTLVEPKGMALYGDYLFVADTAIRIFDVSDVENGNVSFVHKIDRNVNDLIIRENHLFAIGNNGVYQYTLENSTDLTVSMVSELVF